MSVVTSLQSALRKAGNLLPHPHLPHLPDTGVIRWVSNHLPHSPEARMSDEQNQNEQKQDEQNQNEQKPEAPKAEEPKQDEPKPEKIEKESPASTLAGWRA